VLINHDKAQKAGMHLTNNIFLIIFSTRRIGIEAVITKKLCKQEVIGIRMHQFKVRKWFE